MTLSPTVFDRDVPPFGKAGVAEPFSERGQIGRGGRKRTGVEIPDHRHRRLLRPRRHRPRRRAAEQRDEPAPPHHSITSSARASSVGGTSKPSTLAVCKLITSSKNVGCKTGSSLG